MKPRHANNPPDEVMQRQMNCQIKRYHNISCDDPLIRKVASWIEIETGVNPLENIKYRGRKYVQSRLLFMVLLATLTKRTYKYITSFIGKDHSLVNHAIKKVSDIYETEKDFRILYNRLEETVKKMTHE
jgi:chromosomal replication initiation ATPase DnaA